MPGMDGTGRLFRPFTSELPADVQHQVVSYPPDQPLDYAALEPLVPLPRRDFVIVAESFSGPLAIQIASRAPAHLKALVLIATFVRPPLGWLSSFLGAFALPLLFRAPPPRAALRALLLGTHATDALVSETRSVIQSVAPAVLASRLRGILSVDVTRELRVVRVPILYLVGRQEPSEAGAVGRSLKGLRFTPRGRRADAHGAGHCKRGSAEGDGWVGMAAGYPAGQNRWCASREAS